MLIEDSLFFGDYRYPARFHKQKLTLHRATMKRYQQLLTKKGLATTYLEYDADPNSLLRHLRTALDSDPLSAKKFVVADPVDDVLEPSTANGGCSPTPTASDSHGW